MSCPILYFGLWHLHSPSCDHPLWRLRRRGRGGYASPKELRSVWHQGQGDPAYLGAVLRALVQGELISAQV